MNREHVSTRPPSYRAYKKEGCRCYACARAHSEYNASIRTAKNAGTWQPFVDTQPVREHLLMLSRYGIGFRRAAYLAGVPTVVVSRILFGLPSRGRPPSRKIRPDAAEALLRVRPTPQLAADRGRIDATGYLRRMRALVALGFSRPYLCSRLNVAYHNFRIDDAHTHVYGATHRAAAALYDELWDKDPAACGVHPVSVGRAQRYAARRGWVPPLAWDDDTIDDPAATPDLGEQSRRQDAIVEDAAFVASTMRDPDAEKIAARLGISRDYLDAARARHRNQLAGASA